MRNGRTAPSGLLWLLRLGPLATALVLSAHVGSAAGLQAGKQSWTTAPDYRVYDPAATDSGFGRFSRMRVGENGTRVVVRHAGIVGVTLVWKIFVFSPEGRLLSTLGAADLPDGFDQPIGVQADAGGFWVRHSEGSLWYSHRRGTSC